MLDRYFFGDSERISPEAPVPVVRVTRTEERAGGAANVARNIVHLNAQAGLLGITGDDPEGERLAGILDREPMRSELIICRGARTVTKTRIIARHQQIVRLDQEEPLAAAHARTLAMRFEDLIAGYDTIVFSDYHKGSLAEISTMIHAARQAGTTVLVDPGQSDFTRYRGASIITPNLAEFHAAGGDTASDTAMLSSARALLREAGIDTMLLTRSELGASLITAESHQHFPAQVIEVSDITGAGDTVIATLAALLSAGETLNDAARLANLAAGIVVGKLGVSTVSPQELAARSRGCCPAGSGNSPASSRQSLEEIDQARGRGERIVFTNGCFDLLHAGHVRYLARARALGDRLVVGLNSDASVSRLKGCRRPVNSLQDRLEVLAALACVDWVIPFGDEPDTDDTPEPLIRQLRPQVLVKGGDYSPETIIGADFVRQQGGQVVVIPLLEGRSTTALVGRIGEHSGS